MSEPTDQVLQLAQAATAAAAAATAAATAAAATAAAVVTLAADTAAALSKVASDTATSLAAREAAHGDLMARLMERSEIAARDIGEIKALLNGKYVTVEAFAPVRALVYGTVTVMLSSLVGLVVIIIRFGIH